MMIDSNWTLFILLISLLLFSCTIAQSNYFTPETEERWNKLVEASAIRNICDYGSDCEIKWNRAISWIETNSKWKIEFKNDVYIKTYGPGPKSLREAYAVQKIPLDNKGEYEINFIVRCGTVPNCNEKSLWATANFKYYVENGIEIERDKKLSN